MRHNLLYRPWPGGCCRQFGLLAWRCCARRYAGARRSLRRGRIQSSCRGHAPWEISRAFSPKFARLALDRGRLRVRARFAAPRTAPLPRRYRHCRRLRFGSVLGPAGSRADGAVAVAPTPEAFIRNGCSRASTALPSRPRSAIHCSPRTSLSRASCERWSKPASVNLSKAGAKVPSEGSRHLQSGKPQIGPGSRSIGRRSAALPSSPASRVEPRATLAGSVALG